MRGKITSSSLCARREVREHFLMEEKQRIICGLPIGGRGGRESISELVQTEKTST